MPNDGLLRFLCNLFMTYYPIFLFRMIMDRETGRPKGYGFCEYGDQATCEKAVATLNGADLHGRQLRVDMGKR